MFRTSRHAFEPRPYQVEARAAVRQMWSKKINNPLLLKATGTGKTLTALFICQDTLIAGERVVWLAHRRELLTQPLKDLRMFWPRFRGGIVQASRNDVDAQIIFASVDTLRSPGRAEQILAHGTPTLIVVDEAHHSLSPTHRAAIEALSGPDTRLLGLTATADREDGGDLSELWEIAYTYGPVEAIRDGYLVPPYAAVDRLVLDLDQVRITASGDYDESELGHALLLAGVVEHTVAAMQRTYDCERLPYRDDRKQMSARGRSSMVFCASVEQAEKTCDALREAGFDARWICGATAGKDRTRLLRLFREGRLEVLVNVATLTEGTDLPIASAIVLARPTRSWSLYCQILGRGMRLYDGKSNCLVIDLAGASELHSIVSAPVLIGGSRCPVAVDLRHDYQPVGSSTKGRCTLCKHQIACLPGLGAHEWVDAEGPIERLCAACGIPQCSRAPNGRHVWADLEAEQITICVECDVEIPYRGDTLASLAKKGTLTSPPALDPIRVTRFGQDLVPETWAFDVDGHGLVLVVGDRETATWQPFWIRRGAQKPRPLASGPVPREDVRLRCVDLLRRAKRAGTTERTRSGPPTDAQRMYAERLGISVAGLDREQASQEITRAKAWERATSLGLAREAT